jgi:hypothetical protein
MYAQMEVIEGSIRVSINSTTFRRENTILTWVLVYISCVAVVRKVEECVVFRKTATQKSEPPSNYVINP